MTSSGSSASPPSSPARKRCRNDEEEERIARYVISPSKQVLDRMDRALEHRLYLIDKEIHGSSATFDILGSTANVYKVTLDKRSSCDCPDFGRCYTCKHILYVLLRVAKLPRSDDRLWQKALLSSELEDILQMCASNNEAAVLASQGVRQRFNQLTSKGSCKDDGDDEEPVEGSIQRSIEGDCPICYEAMAREDGSPVEELVFCKSCGNNVHKDCFERWSSSKASSGSKVTCIYCRAVWEDKSTAAKTQPSSSAYVNLASYSEDHTEENTSLEVLYPDTYEWIGRRRRR